MQTVAAKGNLSSKITLTILAIAIMILLSPIHLPAQEKIKIKDLFKMSLQELLEVKVTVASKLQETVSNTPSSVTLFTHKEIINLGVSDLEELLNYVPGFISGRTVSAGRTYATHSRGGLSTGILLLINGQPMNSLYGNHWTLYNKIPVENIKQVEIIRGPGSALYGSEAFEGVIKIITFHNKNNASIEGGNLSSRTGSINIAKHYSDWSFSGFIKGFSDKGYTYNNLIDENGDTDTTKDPYQGVDLHFTLKYKKLTINANYHSRDGGDFIIWKRLGNGINNTHKSFSFLNAKYELKLNDKVNINFSAGYFHDLWDCVIKLTPDNTLPVSSDTDKIFKISEHPLIGGPLLKSYKTDFKVDSQYKLNKNNTLTIGLSFQNAATTQVDGQQNYDLSGPLPVYLGGVQIVKSAEFNQIKTRTILGLYLQDKLQIGNSLTATAGVRFDNYSDFGSTLNPRAALVYQTPFNSKIKLMHGRAFRSPAFYALYDKNNLLYVGNPDLKEEKIKTFEVAYIQELKNLQAGFTYFYSKYSNLIVYDFKPELAPLLTYKNAGKNTIYGVEFEIKYSPFKNVYTTGTFTHFLSDDPQTQVPKNLASFSLNYSNKLFNFNFSALYRDKMSLIQNQGSYFVLNSNILINLSRQFRIKINIRNLEDLEFRTHSGGWLPGAPNRGRTFTVGLTADF